MKHFSTNNYAGGMPRTYVSACTENKSTLSWFNGAQNAFTDPSSMIIGNNILSSVSLCLIQIQAGHEQVSGYIKLQTGCIWDRFERAGAGVLAERTRIHQVCDKPLQGQNYKSLTLWKNRETEIKREQRDHPVLSSLLFFSPLPHKSCRNA